jgi:hypothetical protein
MHVMFNKTYLRHSLLWAHIHTIPSFEQNFERGNKEKFQQYNPCRVNEFHPSPLRNSRQCRLNSGLNAVVRHFIYAYNLYTIYSPSNVYSQLFSSLWCWNLLHVLYDNDKKDWTIAQCDAIVFPSDGMRVLLRYLLEKPNIENDIVSNGGWDRVENSCEVPAWRVCLTYVSSTYVRYPLCTRIYLINDKEKKSYLLIAQYRRINSEIVPHKWFWV